MALNYTRIGWTNKREVRYVTILKRDA